MTAQVPINIGIRDKREQSFSKTSPMSSRW